MRNQFTETQKRVRSGEMVNYPISQIGLFDDCSQLSINVRTELITTITVQRMLESFKRTQEVDGGEGANFSIEITAGAGEILIQGDISKAIIGLVKLKLTSEKLAMQVANDFILFQAVKFVGAVSPPQQEAFQQTLRTADIVPPLPRTPTPV